MGSVKANKGIKIVKGNEEQIESVLDSVQRNCNARTVSVKEVFEKAERAEKALARLGIPKTKRAGAIYRYCEGGAWAKSYKFAAGSTGITLKRNTLGWYLTGADRGTYYPGSGKFDAIRLSDAQNEIVMREVRRALSDSSSCRDAIDGIF